MASPLTIKQPAAASHLQQYVLFGLLFAPLIYLRHLKSSGSLLHFNAPGVNLLVHAALVVVPVLTAYALVYKPFEYRESDEIILEPQTFWTTPAWDWWMMFILWASPVLAVLAAFYEGPHLLSHAAKWSTGPGAAFLTMALAFVFGFMFGTLLRMRSQVRLSEEGLRNGITNFYEWGRVDHVSVEGNVYGLYHEANPTLPMSVFKLQKPENQRLLEEYLDRHQIRRTRGPELQLSSVKLCVAAVFFVLVAVGFFLYLTTTIDLRWLLIGVFAASIVATMVLEGVRGLSKVTKTKPLVEPAVANSGSEQTHFLG